MLRLIDKHIFLKRKSLTIDQCNKIINYIDQSSLYLNNELYYLKPCKISSTPHPFLVDVLDKCLHEYVEKHKFLKTLYAPWGIAEDYNLQKYLPGMSYSGEHMEHGKDSYDSGRLLAWMFYLNDVREGGQTCWPQQKFKSNARSGDLLIWPSGWTHSHY